MSTLILTLHILACVALIILVLLQSGKEGMGVIFGGGSASVFGSAGAGGVLVRLTTVIAVIFLCTSLGYNIVTNKKTVTDSPILTRDIESFTQPAPTPAPTENAAPAPTPAGQ